MHSICVGRCTLAVVLVGVHHEEQDVQPKLPLKERQDTLPAWKLRWEIGALQGALHTLADLVYSVCG